MIQEFAVVRQGLAELIQVWEPKLLSMNNKMISEKKNKQNRSVKQIVGHMADSASNNIHRIIHLQYREDPMTFPNYSTNGNNDRWIAIQNYQDEDWTVIVGLWKYLHFHLMHIIENINPDKLENKWLASPGEYVTLRAMVTDFLRHFKLHISEIEELIS